VILDGNTFITYDSYLAMLRGLNAASKKGFKYYKMPYHRVHEEQDPSWLNPKSTIKELLEHAPLKGESQIAFHRTATETFSLGDTNTAAKGTVAKGYGQRNKSYMFKEGSICGRNATSCYCSEVVEGNEEAFIRKVGKKHAKISNDFNNIVSYSTKCGIVLRLWSYPSDNVVTSGLDSIHEKGFFCFLQECERLNIIHPDTPGGLLAGEIFTACSFLRAGVQLWLKKSLFERLPYMTNSTECKQQYEVKFLTNSCFRSQDREIAQLEAFIDIEAMRRDNPPGYKNYCQRIKLGLA
jgi:hypothetical protein